MFVADILVVIVTRVRWKYCLKCQYDQEELVQLGDVSIGFGRHADGQKVLVVNLEYFNAYNTGILSYNTDKWFPT